MHDSGGRGVHRLAARDRDARHVSARDERAADVLDGVLLLTRPHGLVGHGALR